MATLYKDWAPTGFDCKGLALEERQDWLVLPVLRTRDTACALTLANFNSALEILGGESDTVEVHCFNHWGPGWFEIILAAPEHAAKVEEIERRLENYPVLDEEEMSRLECEAEDEAWLNYGAKDFLRAIEKDGFPLLAEAMEDMTDEKVRELFLEWGGMCEHTDEGACFSYRSIYPEISDANLVELYRRGYGVDEPWQEALGEIIAAEYVDRHSGVLFSMPA